MSQFTSDELSEAHRALLSTLGKCEKIEAARLGKSQQTLLERRIAALKVALALIEREQKAKGGGNALKHKIFTMAFSKVYPLYVQKADKKGRTREEVDTVIRWLTGYDERGLQAQIDGGIDFETFFAAAPQINPNAHKITGVICGVRVEEVEDPLMQKIRWLDKLVDELAKGKSLEKILRS